MRPLDFAFTVEGVSIRLQLGTLSEPRRSVITPVELAAPIATPVPMAAPLRRPRRLKAPAAGKVSPTNGRLSVADAIRQVVAAAPRTNAEVFDHVREMLPEALRQTVNTTISRLRVRGEIAKRDDLKWYPVGVNRK